MNRTILLSEDYLYLYAVMLAVLAIFAMLLTVSFFMVVLRGAIEESDDVYELLCVRMIRFQNGEWIVNAGDCFDEYAILDMSVGWTFRMLFWNWNINVTSSGNKTGYLSEPVNKHIKLYRRKIRRG